jgi:hypothetical protein
MYYTKIILEETDTMSVNDVFRLILEERWKFIDDGNGRTRYRCKSPDQEWTENLSYNNPAVEVKSYVDAWTDDFFDPSVVYLGMIKIWNTQSAAQGWVAAVQTLDLPGVTISYHGTTDPSI